MAVFDARHLRQRHGHAAAREHGEVADAAEVQPLVRRRAGHTSMRSVPLRTAVTVTPEISVCSVWAMDCGSRPRLRARSWSTTRRTEGVISFQSKCGSTKLLLSRAMSRASLA